jgi:hypothetical protein
MKRTFAVLALISLSLALLASAVLNNNIVSAQISGYTISSVTHDVEIMFSGHTVIRDTIKVSGDLSNGFLIGLPSRYKTSVLKVVAYDDKHIFPVTLDVPLGSQSGFYAGQVNFEGATPQTFYVAFVLSNSLIGLDFGFFHLDYPAYPSFTTAVGKCSVSVSPPAEISTITISKSDGEVKSTSYSRDNLPAFTNIQAVAAFSIPLGLLQLMDISTLNRKLNMDSAGVLSCSDTYRIKNVSPTSIFAFIMSLPPTATNIFVRDEFGRVLSSQNLGVVGSTLIVNASLISPLSQSQSTLLTADYKLSTGASSRNLNLSVFPAFNYYVDQATFTFAPPEGAKITYPQISASNASASITVDNFQQVLTINKQGVSYVDVTLPSGNFEQISYDYNPVWSSFRPTFWALILSVLACAGVVFWRILKPKGKIPKKEETETAAIQKVPVPKVEAKTTLPSGVKVNADTVRTFLDEYDERKEISAEMKSLDQKAQKGKLPRRQYKVQRRELAVRYDSLTKSINQIKEAFRSSTGGFSDLAKQLDNAEAQLNEAETNIRNLDAKHKSGEISIEEYRSEIGDYQRQKDKAESSLNGILLRIREKTR